MHETDGITSAMVVMTRRTHEADASKAETGPAAADTWPIRGR